LETKKVLAPFFPAAERNVVVLEEIFCDWQEIPFEEFNGDIGTLLKDPSFRTGRLLSLWERGYKVSTTYIIVLYKRNCSIQSQVILLDVNDFY